VTAVAGFRTDLMQDKPPALSRDLSGDLDAIPANRIAPVESVSGRSEPRPVPLPTGFAHLMTVAGRASGEVQVICTCYENGRLWSRTVEAYHTLDDLMELRRQHCGGVA